MALEALISEVSGLSETEVYGRVAGVRGLLVEIAGPIQAMTVGGRVTVEIARDRLVPCEIVGFEADRALALSFGPLDGVRRGCKATVDATSGAVRPSEGWLG